MLSRQFRESLHFKLNLLKIVIFADGLFQSRVEYRSVAKSSYYTDVCRHVYIYIYIHVDHG